MGVSHRYIIMNIWSTMFCAVDFMSWRRSMENSILWLKWNSAKCHQRPSKSASKTRRPASSTSTSTGRCPSWRSSFTKSSTLRSSANSASSSSSSRTKVRKRCDTRRARCTATTSRTATGCWSKSSASDVASGQCKKSKQNCCQSFRFLQTSFQEIYV